MIGASDPAGDFVSGEKTASGTVFKNAIAMPTDANGSSKLELQIPPNAKRFSARVAYRFLSAVCNNNAANTNHGQRVSAEGFPGAVTLHVLDTSKPFNVTIPSGTENLTITLSGSHWCGEVLLGDPRFLLEK
jgi:hypothetical protein